MQFTTTLLGLLVGTSSVSAVEWCGGTEETHQCNASGGNGGCATFFSPVIREVGKGRRFGDGNYDLTNPGIDPCNRDYDGLRLICRKAWTSTAPGEYFADFAGKRCYKSRSGDPEWCNKVTNGFLTFNAKREYFCPN